MVFKSFVGNQPDEGATDGKQSGPGSTEDPASDGAGEVKGTEATPKDAGPDTS